MLAKHRAKLRAKHDRLRPPRQGRRDATLPHGEDESASQDIANDGDQTHHATQHGNGSSVRPAAYMTPSLDGSIGSVLLALFAAIACAAAGLTIWLAFPQWFQFGAAMRGLLPHKEPPSTDTRAEEAGDFSPRVALLLATLMSSASGAVVGAATAVALGGTAVLPWIWLASFVLAAVRLVDAAAARRNAMQATGSLATYLLAERGWRRYAGLAFVVTAPVSAFVIGGFYNGTATRQLLESVADTRTADMATVVMGGLCVAWGIATLARRTVPSLEKVAPVLSATFGAVFLVVIVLLTIVAFGDPMRAIGVIADSLGEAFGTVPAISAFSGAVFGEVIRAALFHGLTPTIGSLGMEGAIHASARTGYARRQAAIAMLPSIVHGVVASLVVIGAASTGAYFTATRTTRPLTELSVLNENGFESVSQRQEIDRYWDGSVRVRDGDIKLQSVTLATERGMVLGPTFEQFGKPGDLLIMTESGRPVDIRRPGKPPLPGVQAPLKTVPKSELSLVRVTGEMLPRGAELIRATISASVLGRGAALPLMVLLAILGCLSAFAWSDSAGRLLGPQSPRAATLALSVMPGAGFLVAAAIPSSQEASTSLVAAVCATVATLACLAAARAGKVR